MHVFVALVSVFLRFLVGEIAFSIVTFVWIITSVLAPPFIIVAIVVNILAAGNT